MAWLRRCLLLIGVAVVAATALTLGDPAPPEAQANVACDIGVAPAAPITGAIGIGNPVGDACNAVTDPVLGALPNPLDPIKDAAESIGSGIFEQITSWAADGATWLLGQVVVLTNKTTSPNLLSKGFLRQYREMASIATVLALLMLIFAVLESLGRGDGGMLVRVFLVNVPVAAIATSAAYVVVQLLVATTDGFSEAIAHATAADTRAFFKSAIEGLSGAGAAAGTTAGGPGAGTAAGAVGVPLFVGFITAMVAAFAAFLVWIELLMRDAAIYAVALFMPMAIAASIWPRWMSALRRTGELLIVVVFSKFVIVSVIALAASLLAHSGGKVEHVLAAGALLLLACFAPFVLFKLVPFAEGAVSSAYNRQSAGGASVRTVEFASSVQMMRRAALANWAVNSSKAKGGSGGGSGGGGSGGSSGAAGRGAARPAVRAVAPVRRAERLALAVRPGRAAARQAPSRSRLRRVPGQRELRNPAASGWPGAARQRQVVMPGERPVQPVTRPALRPVVAAQAATRQRHARRAPRRPRARAVSRAERAGRRPRQRRARRPARPRRPGARHRGREANRLVRRVTPAAALRQGRQNRERASLSVRAVGAAGAGRTSDVRSGPRRCGRSRARARSALCAARLDRANRRAAPGGGCARCCPPAVRGSDA